MAIVSSDPPKLTWVKKMLTPNPGYFVPTHDDDEGMDAFDFAIVCAYNGRNHFCSTEFTSPEAYSKWKAQNMLLHLACALDFADSFSNKTEGQTEVITDVKSNIARAMEVFRVPGVGYEKRGHRQTTIVIGPEAKIPGITSDEAMRRVDMQHSEIMEEISEEISSQGLSCSQDSLTNVTIKSQSGTVVGEVDIVNEPETEKAKDEPETGTQNVKKSGQAKPTAQAKAKPKSQAKKSQKPVKPRSPSPERFESLEDDDINMPRTGNFL